MHMHMWPPRLSSLGLRRIAADDDGNCQFRALSQQLCGSGVYTPRPSSQRQSGPRGPRGSLTARGALALEARCFLWSLWAPEQRLGSAGPSSARQGSRTCRHRRAWPLPGTGARTFMARCGATRWRTCAGRWPSSEPCSRRPASHCNPTCTRVPRLQPLHSGCNHVHRGCHPVHSGCNPTCPACNPLCPACNPINPGGRLRGVLSRHVPAACREWLSWQRRSSVL